MNLIFGGAYQGKTDYAKETFKLKDEEIYVCSEDGNLSEALKNGSHRIKAIDNLENFVWLCQKADVEARDYLEACRGLWKDKVIIMADVSQGIVSIDEDERGWREMMGRTMIDLAKQADSVTRIFCGLPHRLKP